MQPKYFTIEVGTETLTVFYPTYEGADGNWKILGEDNRMPIEVTGLDALDKALKDIAKEQGVLNDKIDEFKTLSNTLAEMKIGPKGDKGEKGDLEVEDNRVTLRRLPSDYDKEGQRVYLEFARGTEVDLPLGNGYVHLYTENSWEGASGGGRRQIAYAKDTLSIYTRVGYIDTDNWSVWHKLHTNRDIATQTQAETGTSNDKIMSPLRTKQVLDSQLLETINVDQEQAKGVGYKYKDGRLEYFLKLSKPVKSTDAPRGFVFAEYPVTFVNSPLPVVVAQLTYDSTIGIESRTITVAQSTLIRTNVYYHMGTPSTFTLRVDLVAIGRWK